MRPINLSVALGMAVSAIGLSTAVGQTAAECKYGITGSAAQPLPRLLALAKSLLEPKEVLIGAWLDTCGVCPVIVFINRPGHGLDHFDVCADGSSTRLQPWAKGDLRWSPVAQITPPSGAKRAWQTPGLTCRHATVLGERTTQCTDKNGDTADRDTFVEQGDGTLLLYQDGVGLSGDHAVATARPIALP